MQCGGGVEEDCTQWRTKSSFILQLGVQCLSVSQPFLFLVFLVIGLQRVSFFALNLYVLPFTIYMVNFKGISSSNLYLQKTFKIIPNTFENLKGVLQSFEQQDMFLLLLRP